MEGTDMHYYQAFISAALIDALAALTFVEAAHFVPDQEFGRCRRKPPLKSAAAHAVRSGLASVIKPLDAAPDVAQNMAERAQVVWPARRRDRPRHASFACGPITPFLKGDCS